MTTIGEARRLIKRVLLANIVCGKRDLSITPLISGRHGIGKSQMIKGVAADLGGTCITIEGGTLKEGEITGLPYQYTDEKGKVGFRFLPYYAVDRIQREEERLFHLAGRTPATDTVLDGDEKFVIWTTTPWTLPGNTAITLHPQFEYAVVACEKGKLIMLKSLVVTLMQKFGIENYEIIRTYKGKDLEYVDVFTSSLSHTK